MYTPEETNQWTIKANEWHTN